MDELANVSALEEEAAAGELHGGWLAIGLAAVSTFLIAGVVSSLSLGNTEEHQVIIGGLAGAVAASIALLLRGGGLSQMQSMFAAHGALARAEPVSVTNPSPSSGSSSWAGPRSPEPARTA